MYKHMTLPDEIYSGMTNSNSRIYYIHIMYIHVLYIHIKYALLTTYIFFFFCLLVLYLRIRDLRHVVNKRQLADLVPGISPLIWL